jgi:PilZ domain
MESPARTRDLSSHGVYFQLSARLEEQSSLEIVLTLPSGLAQGHAAKVRCRARVVRIETVEKGIGAAAVIDRFEFLRRLAQEP